jgi:phospholipase A1
MLSILIIDYVAKEIIMKQITYLLWTGILASALLVMASVSACAQEPADNQNNNGFTNHGGIISSMLQDPPPSSLIFPYEENYFVITQTDSLNREALADKSWVNDARDQEIEYQISIATPLYRGLAGSNSVLVSSFTLESWWQACNDKISSPFRENNYQPKLFLGWAMDCNIGGWALREAEVGYCHQSNGQSGASSHGWNRIYTRFMAEKDNWQIELEPWFLLGTPKENPDITKYLGYYRLKINYHPGNNLITLQGHYIGTPDTAMPN